jgi:RimJ/RimL family protein N-acetyltransferase
MAEVLAETGRLVLRTEVEGDRAVWLEHMNTQQVMEHLGGPQSPEKVAEGFEKMAAAHAAGEVPFLLVALKDDGTLIGKCGLATIATPSAPAELQGQVQVGWTLRADCWGHGYAGEAAEAALGLAFGRYALGTVYGQTSESNAPSWRLIERLGMVRRGELDYDDPDYPPRDNPTKVYSLERSAWQERRA